MLILILDLDNYHIIVFHYGRPLISLPLFIYLIVNLLTITHLLLLRFIYIYILIYIPQIYIYTYIYNYYFIIFHKNQINLMDTIKSFFTFRTLYCNLFNDHRDLSLCQCPKQILTTRARHVQAYIRLRKRFHVCN